ncbi:hypothetical protein G3N56_11670 [Desulfovibrio sulfodismutans]|uniref:Uncharacterized protein n=1 Tax=Desulfolutivibrio sulfodismutans TaxID=63561 RepID=A0A7K3NQB0_9BACT|nr:phage tail tube protein [Desulfolutivibrio sulfodismutans]NDY57399.1 hypothetical protein [Desulfolutivibrio sulfodismutans]QLA11881.1 hypothetical protein GD606_06205 [Desulfolutivibrio sulfodismutans DSM 3696]QLA13540.1 hypothetical protein GD606_15340 [Desulfolutivibrio sulfodismutans DSM 3696]
MALLTRVMALLAATEATYGVAPAADQFKGILCNSGSEISPTGDKIERDTVRSTFSPAASKMGAKRQQLTVTTELRGGGLGVGGEVLPPDYAPFLLACGMQATAVVRLTLTDDDGGKFAIGEAITSGTATGTLHHIDARTLVLSGVEGTFAEAEIVTGGLQGATATVAAGGVAPGLEYRPVTARVEVQKSACVKYHKDSILHQIVGARGTAVIDCQVGKIPTIKWTLTGLWADPAAAVLPNPDLTDLSGPVFVNAGVVIGAYEPIISALSLDIGNTIAERVSANGADGLLAQYISGRRSTGSLDPEVDALAAYNPWVAWKDATPARIAATIGNVPGNRIRLEVPQAANEDLKYGERNGLATYQQPFVASIDRDGDDEWRITFF